MKNFEIRNSRNGDWHWVNNAVTADPHLTPAEKVTYYSLATFGGCKEIHPDFELLSKRSSLSSMSCKRAIKKLVKIGYISFIKGGGRGKSNVYDLLKASKGCLECQKGYQNVTVSQTVTNSSINSNNLSDKGYQNVTPIDKYIDKYKDNILYSASFLSFYENYPIKKGKKAAWKAWLKAKDKPDLEIIMGAVEKQRSSRSWREGYIPHPSTWLNQGRWDDEIEEERSSKENEIPKVHDFTKK